MRTILTILVCLFTVHVSKAQWVQAGTFASPVQAILSVQTSDAVGNEIIFVGLGEMGGVWKSTDDGDTWTQTSMEEKTIHALAASGSYIMVGSDEDGVYFSSNSGTTWNQTSLNNRTVYAFTESGGYLYAGTKDYGVYCSANNGLTWFQTSLNNKTVKSLTSSGNLIYAGTLNSGVYKSTNYGTNWSQTPLNNLHIVSIAINGNNIIAGTDYTGIWRSINNGMDWTQTNVNNFAVFVLRFLVIYSTAFAGTANGMYTSGDNGASWNQRNEGIPGSAEVRSLTVSENYVYTGIRGNFDGTENRIYRRPLNELIGIEPVSNEVPEHFNLSQNYPNPFNPATKIRFALPKTSFAKLVVYDILGRVITTLVDEELRTGTYEVDFDGKDHPSGLYFYSLTVDSYTQTNKMILVK